MIETDIEQWLPVVDFEGQYQVSTHGRVKSLKKIEHTILKYRISKGYPMITFQKNGKYKTKTIHVLMAQAFLGHIPDGTHKIVVDHIDNNPLNNHISNLQLISNRENLSKDRSGTSKYTGVSWNKAKSKWIANIRIKGIKKHLGAFTEEIDASNAYIEMANKLREQGL